MTAVFITILVGLSAIVLARRADRRFRDQDSLPMQWWFDGRVTWSAPRTLALAIIPALGFMTLAFVSVLSMTVPGRPGQEHLVTPVVFLIATAFLAIQILHHALIARTLDTGRGW